VVQEFLGYTHSNGHTVGPKRIWHGNGSDAFLRWPYKISYCQSYGVTNGKDFPLVHTHSMRTTGLPTTAF